MHDAVRASTEGPVGRLTLHRPEKRNALTQAMWRAIPAAVGALAGDGAVRAVVLTGAGGHFAAGADIGEFEEVYATRARAAEYAADVAAAMEAVAGCAKPVIAMLRGACVGGGLGLALCADLRFASDDARFAITPSRLGLVYSFADTARLVGCVGAAAAKDMLFSARALGAEEALRLRLIDRLCPPDALEGAVAEYAAGVASLSHASIATTKRFVAAISAGQHAETGATSAAYLDALDGPDFAEGRAAFLARRAPRFNAT